MNAERPYIPDDPADAAGRLDRLWAATRPEAPSVAIRAAVWADVAHALDAAPAPAPAPSWWARHAWSLRTFAAAAAVLLAVLLVVRDRDRAPVGAPAGQDMARVESPTTAEPAAPPAEVVLDAGQVAVLHADADGAVQVVSYRWDGALADDFEGPGFGASASELDVIAALEDMGLSTLALDTTGTLP